MPYEDPLANLTIIKNLPAVHWLSQAAGFTVLDKHIDEVLGAVIFYETIHRLSQLISPRIVSPYKTLSRRTQINFDIHVVSMVQSVLICFLSYPLFGDKVLAADTLNGYTPYAGFVSSVGLGYFIWDTYVSARYVGFFGPGFLFHGIAATIVFIQALRPYALHYAPHFLWFELSTPLLNVHWFATHLPPGTVPDIVQLVNGLLLMATFFTARIGWGIVNSYNFGTDTFSNRAKTPVPDWVPTMMMASNLLLNSLNIYWFSKMISLVSKRFSGKTETAKKVK